MTSAIKASDASTSTMGGWEVWVVLGWDEDNLEASPDWVYTFPTKGEADKFLETKPGYAAWEGPLPCPIDTAASAVESFKANGGNG